MYIYKISTFLIISIYFLFFSVPANCQTESNIEIEYSDSYLWNTMADMALKDSIVYCGMVNGIRVLNVKNSANPIQVNRLDLDHKPSSLKVEDNLLFVGLVGYGLQIYNIANPINPILIGEYLQEININDIEISDNYAYLAVANCGLWILAITDPSNPIQVSEYNDICNDSSVPQDLILVGDTLIVAAYSIWALDVSDPYNPTEINHFSTSKIGCHSVDICLVDFILFVADLSNVQPSGISQISIYCIKDLMNPYFISSYNIFGNVWTVNVANDYLFVGAGASGLAIFDISSIDNPVPFGCLSTIRESIKVIVVDSIAYVQNTKPTIPESISYDICGKENNKDFIVEVDTGDFVILNVSDVTNPYVVGKYPESGFSTGIEIINDYGFVLDDHGSVTILNVGTPYTHDYISKIETFGIPMAVDVSDSLLLIANNINLLIVTIADINNPQVIGSYTHFDLNDVKIKGNYAYIAGGADGLLILDISNPEIPTLVGQYNTPDYACKLAFKDHYSYIADRYSGIQVIDVSDPTNPLFVSQYPNPNEPTLINNLVISGDYIYSEGISEVDIISIIDPANPTLVSNYFASSTVYDIDVISNYLVLAIAYDGLEIVDITKLTEPKLGLFYNTPGVSLGVSCFYPFIYVADIRSLLKLKIKTITGINDENDFEGELPKSFILYQNYPNPFNNNTIIEFSLFQQNKVDLSIYNILGQKTVTLLSETIPAGTYKVAWDGKKNRGEPVSSGIYMYRLLFDGASLSRKMLLLK